MRIVSGKYKRTPLNTLEGDLTRPTKDMVKEALFDSLQVKKGDSFLDLFSGSGAIGIEAISRDASPVVFNDNNKDAVKIIESNLDKINEHARVLNLDYKECLQKLRNNQFDYIFVDPPYIFDEYLNILELVNSNNVLNNLGIIVFEVKKTVDLPQDYLTFKQTKVKKYGLSKLIYYKKEG